MFRDTGPDDKRRRLRRGIESGSLQRLPGAYNPLVALLIERQGWEGVYVSGAVLANDLGLPDVGLTTMSEVVGLAGQIAEATDLPTVVDADTGFGEAMNVGRSVRALERAGLAGCHFEDQRNPKRCGHLDRKTLVEPDAMVQKLRAAGQARRDPDFLLIARTDARGVEGFEAAVERARAYLAAGADMIFPEALRDEAEFAAFRHALPDAPLMANMTEFGRSPLLDATTLERLGYNLVIYPVTTQRLALGAVERGLAQLKSAGHQRDLLTSMQTRSELYDLIEYERYATFDRSVFDFEVPEGEG
jgi:methylisocitrate lyase